MIYRFDHFVLDAARFELRRKGEMLAAEPQVLSLLILLVESRDRLVTKEELIERVWKGRIVSDAAVTSRIKSARQLLGDDGRQQRYIRTIHGKGLRFVGDVEESEPVQTQSVADTETAATPGSWQQQRVEFCTAADGTGLAYSCVGDGPPLVKTANWLNHLEYEWESPIWSHWIHELSREHRLLRYDERGNGLSDWKVEDMSFEAFVDDLETVVAAAGFDGFDLFGISQGCAVSIAYAVRHPERVRSLILHGGYATGWKVRSDPEEVARREAMITLTKSGWGQDNPAYRQMFTTLYVPDASHEEADWFNELQRISASPESAIRLQDALARIDVRDLLGQVRIPTIVFHSREDAVVPFDSGRFMAKKIPGARFVALDSKNHLLLEHEPAWRKFVATMREFLAEQEG
ncbi:alpha/beta fold hydrolase [Parasphingopyxis algicola]|uniref:alpha/beta fold hydrolase n=1 Tax=Parasphingopyxis algicola TaxID=2026624 RepID=UPI0015A356F5|nr:alpha/beta fold hydrolase [Parasphingopyxis algicola]QLC26761.1 alpha/beta fold hydrolase [Parasphingopyxis algicola]